MTKTEFIERLCEAIAVSGPAALVEKNRAYYTEYIEGEAAKGRTEEEVLAELGEPELIAHSILEANGYRDRFVVDDAKTYNAYDTPDGDPTTFAQGFEYKGKDDRSGGNSPEAGSGGSSGDGSGKSGKGMSLKTRLIIAVVIVILVMIGIVVLLVALVGGIISILAPILIPLICVLLIIKLIRSLSGK